MMNYFVLRQIKNKKKHYFFFYARVYVLVFLQNKKRVRVNYVIAAFFFNNVLLVNSVKKCNYFPFNWGCTHN